MGLSEGPCTETLVACCTDSEETISRHPREPYRKWVRCVRLSGCQRSTYYLITSGHAVCFLEWEQEQTRGRLFKWRWCGRKRSSRLLYLRECFVFKDIYTRSILSSGATKHSGRVLEKPKGRVMLRLCCVTAVSCSRRQQGAPWGENTSSSKGSTWRQRPHEHTYCIGDSSDNSSFNHTLTISSRTTGGSNGTKQAVPITVHEREISDKSTRSNA